MNSSDASTEMESKRVYLHVPHNVLLFLAAHQPASNLYFLRPAERPSVIAHSHLRRERAAHVEARRGALPTACPLPNKHNICINGDKLLFLLLQK